MQRTMKKFISSLLLVCCGICAHAENIAPLSDEELGALDDMNQQFKASSTTSNAKQELLGANILPDSKDPSKFQPTATIELERVKFSTDRFLFASKKWGEIRIDIKTRTNSPDLKWADNCRIKLYVGFNNCLPSGKMLLLKSDCTCVCLEKDESQSIRFFIPGDIRARYNLSKVPDYCDVQFSVDGHEQDIIIVNQNGENSYVPKADNVHKNTKKSAQVESHWMRNADQIPPYADIKLSNHPTLELPIDL